MKMDYFMDLVLNVRINRSHTNLDATIREERMGHFLRGTNKRLCTYNTERAS